MGASLLAVGTTAIEGAVFNLDRGLGELREAIARLDRFMQTRPTPKVMIRVTPVESHRLPEPQTGQPRQQVAETN